MISYPLAFRLWHLHTCVVLSLRRIVLSAFCPCAVPGFVFPPRGSRKFALSVPKCCARALASPTSEFELFFGMLLDKEAPK